MRKLLNLRQVVTRLSAPLEIAMRYRGMVKFLLHIAIFVLAYQLAYIIRFDFNLPRQYLSVIRDTIPVLLFAKALGFLAFGLFSGWWRYVSIRDILPITGGCMLGSALFAGAVSLYWGRIMSRG
jgi:FlaA1/EpsC-like NDP-sugar epimerase